MYSLDQVISALDRFCADHGETVEQRETRLAAANSPIKPALRNAGDPVLNRNLRLALSQLQIETDAFLPYLEDQSG